MTRLINWLPNRYSQNLLAIIKLHATCIILVRLQSFHAFPYSRFCSFKNEAQPKNEDYYSFLPFLGRIKAIQLDYTDAYRHLLQAARKAPQSNAVVGFQQLVHKNLIIVQLLMGEIPERSLFRQASFRRALLPYFHLVQGNFLLVFPSS
jgi:hypothetical protein